eukprot:1492651-Pyramimonas_sp.AAC.1
MRPATCNTLQCNCGGCCIGCCTTLGACTMIQGAIALLGFSVQVNFRMRKWCDSLAQYIRNTTIRSKYMCDARLQYKYPSE